MKSKENQSVAAAPGSNDEHVVIKRLRARMADEGFDALVALSPDNVTYAAGFLVPSHASNRFRRTMTVIAKNNVAVQIVVSVELAQAQQRSRFKDVRSYDQFNDQPARVLAGVLSDAGLANSRIADELDYLPARDFILLKSLLPNATFEECDQIYFKERMVKTDEELEILREIGIHTETVLGRVARQIRAGMTEIDVSRPIVDEMVAFGSATVKYRVGSGINSSITNCGTTSKVIEAGDIIRIEVLGDYKNYRSNVTRTLVVGSPTRRQKDIWATLISARETCQSMARPGLPVADLYRKYAELCRASGVEPTLQFLGHGIGQTIHEEPYITERRDTVFQPNMTFTMEPLLMLPAEKMGFHVEDMYLINETGCERITGNVFNNDELIEVG